MIFFFHFRDERQQAVALWWKSKPFWKKMKNKHSPGSPVSPQGTFNHILYMLTKPKMLERKLGVCN